MLVCICYFGKTILRSWYSITLEQSSIFTTSLISGNTRRYWRNTRDVRVSHVTNQSPQISIVVPARDDFVSDGLLMVSGNFTLGKVLKFKLILTILTCVQCECMGNELLWAYVCKWVVSLLAWPWGSGTIVKWGNILGFFETDKCFYFVIFVKIFKRGIATDLIMPHRFIHN